MDVNNVATSNFAAPRPNTQTGKGGGNHPRPQGQGQGQGNNNNKKNNNKDRFKKPVIKQEVSEEDVAKQVKETLARLTTKGKNKLPSTARKNVKWLPTVCRNWKIRKWQKARY